MPYISEINSGQNFSTIESYLGEKGPRLPETPKKRPHFMGAAYRTRKEFEIYNLTTRNATTLMRLTKIMNHLLYYFPPHHKTFNLAEDWGVTYQGRV